MQLALKPTQPLSAPADRADASPCVSREGLRSVDALACGALLYLLLPTLIWFASWFRPAYAAGLCTLTVVGYAAACRSCTKWRPRAPVLVACALVALAWSALGGAGHLFHANALDWKVRDAVLRDLTVADAFPPAYDEVDGMPQILRAPVAYYLPAALFGRLFGLAGSDIALLAWTAAGVLVFLLLLPLSMRPRWQLGAGLLTVVLFSGMDILGWLATRRAWPGAGEHIEWWTQFFQYSSNSTLLFWTPHHALPGWIAAALFLRHGRHASFLRFAPMLAASIALWSPFALIGLIPLLAVPAWRALCDRRHLRMLTIAACLPALGVLAVVTRYLLLDSSTIPGGLQPWGWRFFAAYGAFVTLESLAIGILLARVAPTEGLWIAIGTLVLLPLVRFGQANDLVMRASIPALCIMCVAMIRSWQAAPRTRAGKAAQAMLVVALGIGAITPWQEIERALSRPRWSPDLARSLCVLQGGVIHPNYVARLNQPGLSAMFNDVRIDARLACQEN